MKTALVFLLLPLIAGVSLADDRPGEDSMFGSPEASTAAAASAPSVPASGRLDSRSADEAQELTPGRSRDAFASGAVANDALQIGGTFYQRWIASKPEGQKLGNSPESMPLQFDAYMDARPNDRVRGYVQERILYDPTLDQYGNSTKGSGLGNQQFSSNSGAPSSLPTGATAQATSNPMAVLDQAWLKFDLGHDVFVTAGKQHVKWGVSRFWNPTDFLSTMKRDPLLPYDLRLGNTMVRLAMPLEKFGANFYAITLIDNPQPASAVGQLGEAARVEKLFGNTEVGLEALGRGGAPPTFGGDVSSPLGPFDVYAEAALFGGSPVPVYQLNGTPTTGESISSLYSMSNPRGAFVQTSGGIRYEFPWMENRQATAGAEYFYNQEGYNNGKIYPVLIFTGAYQPFYTGRHYGAVYVTAEGPDQFKHTSYTFSTIGNLSDGSFITRVDFSWRFLTYLTFEAYGDEHYGTKGGEFNFELHTPALINGTAAIPPISVPTTLYDVGLGLRLSF
ncbi:MAG: hypothetical protein ACHQ49_12305 [Elusimicrobiota bacterium]